MERRAWGLFTAVAVLAGCAPLETKDAGTWAGAHVPAGWEGWPYVVASGLVTGYGRERLPNPIPAENALAGDPDWQSGRPPYAQQVMLYTSADSVEAGRTVAVQVSLDINSSVTAQVFRLGYYGGAGARQVWSGGPYAAAPQGVCPVDAATELVACHWPDTFSFIVGPQWVSGVYLVKVTRPDGFFGFAPFVVRDHRAADILFQRSNNTDQAYNAFQGESLYQDASGTMPTGMAHAVSFERPYLQNNGAGLVLSWEYWLLRFMEAQGYDVSYGTNQDLSRYADFVYGVGAFVSGGHDEYWLQDERDQLDTALAKGDVNVAYFGANGGYWRSRYAADEAGTPLRTLISYKGDPEDDPIPGSTVRFRDPPTPEPENALWGVMYADWLLMPFSLTVADPTHWLFAGTGMAAGEQLYGLAGYEFDRTEDDGAGPPGLSISLQTPTLSAEGLPNFTQAADYALPSGSTVFAAGSIYWSLGLSTDPHTHDGRLERMTLNVLERALARRRPPRSLPPVSGPVPTLGPTEPAWASGVAAYAGAPGPGTSVDGPAALAHFNGPTGLAVLSSGAIAVTDTVGNQIRLIGTDAAHTVTTLAGTGQLGLLDGPGAFAQFRNPTAVVQAPDGSLLVADSDNDNIRRIGTDSEATVSTYAGGPRMTGTADGAGTDARFNMPTALALDGAGNLYVVDQGNARIRKVAAGTLLVTTVAGSTPGFTDAIDGLQAQFDYPSAIAVAPDGTLYVFDGGNQVLRVISASATHAVTTLAGSSQQWGYADGVGSAALFRAQMGLVVDGAGSLLLGDAANYRVRKIVPGATAGATHVYTFAGSGQQGTALGAADVADIVAPAGLALSSAGTLFVTDSYNNVVLEVTP